MPAFYLRRWAAPDGRLQVYSRDSRKFSTRNVKDLGIKDFYTFINIDGSPDSRYEMVLERLENEAATVLEGLLSTFAPISFVSHEQRVSVATFVAFQMARGPRRRREEELLADYYAKTVLGDAIPDGELEALTIGYHQNEHIGDMGPHAQNAIEHIASRPFCLVVLDRPLLFTSDEPVIVNVGGNHVLHHADCALTETQIEARLSKERRKKKRLQRDVKRVVHISSAQPRGIKRALEVILPLSPRTALLYGPKGNWTGTVERDRLEGAEADEFARKVNQQMITYALDLVAAHPNSGHFPETEMPPVEPILTVCDGSNAARISINRVPTPLRPQRFRWPA